MVKIPVYPIESGVPAPALRGDGISSMYPLRLLEVGQSILFPSVDRTRVQVYANQIKRSVGRVFTVRKVDADTCRVWRVS